MRKLIHHVDNQLQVQDALPKRIGILLDFNKKKAFYFKNGTFLKVKASIYQGNTYFPSVHIYYPKDKVTISMKQEKDFPKGDFY
jgi:hypothetical protein